MPNILIAGCGDVGTALGLRLAADGNRVYGLRRNVSALPAALTPLAADLASPSSLRSLPEVDYVYFTAAADGRDETAYRRAYVTGLRNLVEAVGAQRVRRLIFVSSTSVYGQRAGEWVDEDSDTSPARFTGAIVLDGEREARASSFPVTAVRFGGIYGPGRNRLIDKVLSGAGCVDHPPVYTNRIHRDDCAGVLQHLLTLPEPAAVYLGVDCEPAPQCAVMDWLARQLDAPQPRRKPAPADPDQGKRASNARLLASGYSFLYPTFREGYADVIRRVRSDPGEPGGTE